MMLQEKMVDWENLCQAYQQASRHKRGRRATACFETLLADNLLELQMELADQSYKPGRYHSFFIHEPKKRLISAAPFRDRVVHHALCKQCVPYFEHLFIKNSFANQLGKGTHRALDCCQQYSRRYKYALQCDIKQFFPSIDHVVLKDILRAMLPDGSLNWLIESIINSGQGVLSDEYEMVYFREDDLFSVQRPRGLPIGNLTSQWWANCYLNSFDHFVCRELSCKAYLRYVDDFILFSNSKRELMYWRSEIIRRLERFRLRLHEESAFPRSVGEGLPFLGFIIFPDHRRLKPRKGYHYRKKLRATIKNGAEENIRASLQGWLQHVSYGDTYGLRRSLLKDVGLLARETSDA